MRKVKRRLVFFKKTSFFIFIFFISLLLAKLFTTHLFLVKTIMLEGGENLKLDIKHYGGSSLFLLNPKRIAEDLEEKNVKIKKAVVSKKFPSTLLIKVETREPIGVITDKSGNSFLVDEEGVVFEEKDDQNIPSLRFGIHNLAEGQILESRLLLLALKIAKEIKKREIRIEEVVTDDFKKEIKIKIRDGPKVYLSEDKDPKETAASLQLVINRFKIEGKKPEKIDFRFTHPIVTFSREATVSAEF